MDTIGDDDLRSALGTIPVPGIVVPVMEAVIVVRPQFADVDVWCSAHASMIPPIAQRAKPTLAAAFLDPVREGRIH